jgi:hypothetical protein
MPYEIDWFQFESCNVMFCPFCQQPVYFHEASNYQDVDAFLSSTTCYGSDPIEMQSVAAAQLTGISPGWAVIDTGCTSSLIGQDNVQAWKDELKHASHGSLQPICFHDETSFRGIGGVTQSLGGIGWPSQFGPHLGQLKTSIIPGNAPCLVSSNALQLLGATLDMSEPPSVTFRSLHNQKVQLQCSANGHLLLPLFQFDSSVLRRNADFQQEQITTAENDMAETVAGQGFLTESQQRKH